MPLETWELLSYVVTVVGLPLAIAVFLFEQRKERENEDEEVYQLLSDNYQDFLKVALENPDLRLFSDEAAPSLSDEQKERQLIIFTIHSNAWCEMLNTSCQFMRARTVHAPICDI